MVLTVPFEGFAEAAKSRSATDAVYVTTLGGHCVATFADPATGVIVRSHAMLPAPEVRQMLEDAGFQVRDGLWGDRSEDPNALWVAAVAYKSGEDTPGIWVETYDTKPSTGQVLGKLYDEFRASGDVGDVPLEEFIRQADPNVVILSPEQQAEFARRSRECD